MEETVNRVSHEASTLSRKLAPRERERRTASSERRETVRKPGGFSVEPVEPVPDRLDATVGKPPWAVS